MARGRPKKSYPQLDLHSTLEAELRRDERVAEWLTPEWLTAYRITFPDAWRRMREKLAATTIWSAATLTRKSRLEVRGLTDKEVDNLNLMRWVGRNRNREGKRQPLHRYACFGDGAFIDPDEPREMNFRQFVLIDEGRFVHGQFLSEHAKAGDIA